MTNRVKIRDQHWFVAAALILGWVMIGILTAIGLYVLWTVGFRWSVIGGLAVMWLMLLKIMRVLEQDEEPR